MGLRKKIQFGKMANPGDDRRTRSQTAQSFISPRGDFEGESGDVPTSTPSETTQMMVEFSGPRREGPRETRREQSEKLSNGKKSEDLQQSEKLSNGRKSEDLQQSNNNAG